MARAVMLLKFSGADSPKLYKPISVSSVITRSYHKFLALRFGVAW